MYRSFILLLAAVSAWSQNQVSLKVDPAYPGHVAADNSIRLDQLGSDSAIHLQVVIENLDFPLAAAQFRIQYQPGLVFADDSETAFLEVDPPVALGSAIETSVSHLYPCDPEGRPRPDRIANQAGWLESAILIRDRESFLQPTSGPLVLASITLYPGLLVEPNCFTDASWIRIKVCAEEGDGCDLFLNGKAVRQSLTAGNTSVEVKYPAALQKGNITRYQPNGVDADIDFSDLVALMRCSQFGQAGCRLSSLSQAQYLQVTDINCDGSTTPDFADMAELIRWILNTQTKHKQLQMLTWSEGPMALGTQRGLALLVQWQGADLEKLPENLVYEQWQDGTEHFLFCLANEDQQLPDLTWVTQKASELSATVLAPSGLRPLQKSDFLH